MDDKAQTMDQKQSCHNGKKNTTLAAPPSKNLERRFLSSYFMRRVPVWSVSPCPRFVAWFAFPQCWSCGRRTRLRSSGRGRAGIVCPWTGAGGRTCPHLENRRINQKMHGINWKYLSYKFSKGEDNNFDNGHSRCNIPWHLDHVRNVWNNYAT